MSLWLSHFQKTLKHIEAQGMSGGESEHHFGKTLEKALNTIDKKRTIKSNRCPLWTLFRLFNNQTKMNSCRGFTLAEVLITLGIIGIVAAMTLPAIVQKQQEKVTVTKLKKAYSVINQAYLMALNEHGDINNWGFLTDVGVDEDGIYTEAAVNNIKLFWSRLTPYMGITSMCIDYPQGNCPMQKDEYELNGKKRKKASKSSIKLKDGISFHGGWISNADYCSANSSCGDFSVDINGPDAYPNTVGKDIFYFYVYKNKVLPMGTSMHEKDGSRKFSTHCLNGGDGYGCTAWVIYNENMDYLHCGDLSWDGKKKCK